jgi:hypothetical protein
VCLSVGPTKIIDPKIILLEVPYLSYYSLQYNWHLGKSGDLIRSFVVKKYIGSVEKVQMAVLYYSYMESCKIVIPPGGEE